MMVKSLPSTARAISNFNAHRREATTEAGKVWASARVAEIYAATRPAKPKRTRKAN